MFIPTIDISNKKAVLVTRGKVTTVLGDPMEKAKELAMYRHFQIVDIDAAIGNNKSPNREIIKQIVKKYPCYVGGGIRTLQDAQEMLNSSARRVIIGSNPELLKELPMDRTILAIDLDDQDNILTHGRTITANLSLCEYLEKYVRYVEMICITFHDAEGGEHAIPFTKIKRIQKLLKAILLASDENWGPRSIRCAYAGGIQNIKQVRKIIKMGAIPQFGAAFWKGNFTMGDLFISLLNTKKQVNWCRCRTAIDGPKEALFPCIVQNIDGIVLGLVYCTVETLKMSIDTQKATFYSRESRQVWIKGESSGNYHTLQHVDLCCDNTAIRMVVSAGDRNFCHKGQKSCFGHSDPARGSLHAISQHIKSRSTRENTKNHIKTIQANEIEKINYIKTKLKEEIEELIYAETVEDQVYESADVLYFLMKYLIQQGIDISEIESELIKRQYKMISPPAVVNASFPFKIGIVNDLAIRYLEQVFDIKITRETSERCYTYATTPERNIQIIPCKPKDISLLINSGYIDGIVSFEDVVQNYHVNVVKAPSSAFIGSKIDIIIAIQKSKTMSDLVEINKSRKLVIMAEYKKFIIPWLKENNLTAKVESVSGHAESYLANGLCDLCVVVRNTGKTLSDNKLDVLAVLITTSIHLFISSTALDKFATL